MLKDHDNPVWNVGANLLAPLFRGGALKTQVEIRTAEQKQAIAEYAVSDCAPLAKSKRRWPPSSRRATARRSSRERSPTISRR